MDEEMMTDEGEIQIISLKDEDGNDLEFEVLDELEYEGSQYCALLPYYENPEELDEKSEEDTEILIIRVSKDENGEEFCETVDDDELFDKLSALFDERIEKMYDE